MRPIPIPDNEVWPGTQRIIMEPPDGDLLNDTIRPVEMLFDPTAEDGIGRLHTMFVLEEGDLEILQRGGRIWLSFMGIAIAPFSMMVAPQMIDGSVGDVSGETEN